MPDNRINIIIDTQRTGSNQVNQVRNELSQLGRTAGKSSKNVQSATGRMASNMAQPARSAQELSQKWQIGMNQARSSMSSLNNTTKKMGNTTQKTSKQTGEFRGSLTALAWNFRYLNRVVEQAVQRLYQFLRSVTRTGIELEESYFAMEAAASMYGESQEQVTQIVEDFADKGLTSLKSTSKAVRDLVTTGMEVDKISDVMQRYADVTSLLTSSHEGMENSLRTLTESIIRGTTVLATDTSARLVWGMAQKRARQEMGKTIKQLSAEERALLVHRTLKEDLANLEGLHRAEMQLTSAALTRATTAWQKLQKTLFDEMAPILHGIFFVLGKIAGAVGWVVKALGALGPSFLMVFSVVATLISAFTSLMAVGLVTSKIFTSMTGAIASYVGMSQSAVASTSAFSIAGQVATATLHKMWMALIKIVGPVMIVTGVVSYLAYKLLELNGVFDSHAKKSEKAKDMIAEMGEEYDKIKEIMSGTGEEAAGSGDQIKDYNRKIADLQEDIAREESLGLWRDEEKLADLRKELRRTKEDKQAAQESGDSDGGMLSEEKKAIDEMREKVKKLNTEMAEVKPTDYLTLPYKIMYYIDKAKKKIRGFVDTVSNYITDELPEQIRSVDWVGVGASVATSFYNAFAMVLGGLWDLGGLAIGWISENSEDWIKAGKEMSETMLNVITLGAYDRFMTLGKLAKQAIRGEEVEWEEVGRLMNEYIYDVMTFGSWRFFRYLSDKSLGWINGPGFENVGEAIKDAILDGLTGIAEGIINSIKDDLGLDPITFESDTFTPSLPGGNLEKLQNYSLFGEREPDKEDDENPLFNSFSSKIPGMSMGGIVPGRPGEPQLILAHGGEEIIPRWGRGNSSPVINFNGDFKVRNDQDIERIANKVGKVLGRKNRRSRIR